MLDAPSTDTQTPIGLEDAGFAAMRAEAVNPERPPEEEDDVAADVMRAKAELTALHAERDAFDRSRADRDDLRTRYPAAKLSELITNVMQWDRQFKADPRSAADRIARYYLDQPGYGAKVRDEQQREESARSVDKAASDDPEADIRAAMREIAQRAAEDEEFKASAEQRKALKEMFPHLRLDQAIKRIVALDRELRDDPLRAAERLAATYGLPVTAQHQQEAAQAVQVQQATATLEQDMDQAVAAGALPGIEHMMPELGAVFRSSGFVRTGNFMVDVATAYQAALPAVVARLARERQSQAVERAKHASGSIAGAPTPGIVASADRRMGEDDLEADIRAAMRQI